MEKQKGYTIEDEKRVTQVVGKAYTHKEVSNTEVDPVLCQAIVSEILTMPEFRAEDKNILLRLQEMDKFFGECKSWVTEKEDGTVGLRIQHKGGDFFFYTETEKNGRHTMKYDGNGICLSELKEDKDE